MNKSERVLTEEELEVIAGQLRKPTGEVGREVARKMNEGNLLMNRFAIAALTASPGDHVLEIGMGNGFFAGDVLELAQDVRYTGVDFSEEMIEASLALNKLFVDAGIARFVLADVNALPFDDESFDAVLSVNTFYFWDAGKALPEIRRVLKLGGSLVLAIRPRHLMRHYPFVKYGFQMYSAEELSSVLATHGFTVSSVEEHSEPSTEFGGHELELGTVVVVGSPGYE